MNKKEVKNIVFLYSELMGYNIGVLRSLTKLISGEITVIHWDMNKKSKYSSSALANTKFINRSQITDSEITNLLIRLKPDIIYISGWMDKGYIKALKEVRKKLTAPIIVAGMDNQFTGSLRQYLGKIVFDLRYRKIFDFAWVPGNLQYIFARHLGFKKDNILRNLLSADTEIFKTPSDHMKRFVFVGRLAEEKNIKNLITAYKSLPSEVTKIWSLDVYGNGPLKKFLIESINENINLHGFLQPQTLIKELASGGVYILPSLSEPWGVAIHEMALLGFPMLLSKRSGAASTFLIEGYNGYSFEPDSVDEIRESMLKISSLNTDHILEMKKHSVSLGNRITPEIAAHSLLSAIYR